ncbi:MAG: pyridoxamine 5'-phosphate oxidase [Candidatus Kapaibacterium sp.]
MADIRREYRGGELREADLSPDPFVQFHQWFAEAAEREGTDVNAMTLATVSAQGRPSARIVLLKGVDSGFLFFSNYESKKGEDLEGNPSAALVFWWRSLNRQVRIEGEVAKISPEESDIYFQSRPRGSRIGAIASPQSHLLENRETLEERINQLSTELQEEAISRPDYWGGYRLKPNLIEFWQGRENRLHDRLRYRLYGGEWVIERLAP